MSIFHWIVLHDKDGTLGEENRPGRIFYHIPQGVGSIRGEEKGGRE